MAQSEQFDDEVREAGRRLERIRALRAQDDPDDDAIGVILNRCPWCEAELKWGI